MNILLVKTGKENKMMSNDELKAIGCTPIEDLISEDFGAIGTEERNEFENGCEAFIIGEQLKAERLKAGMTQEQLAAKIGTKKSYISRIENGHADIQLSKINLYETIFSIICKIHHMIQSDILPRNPRFLEKLPIRCMKTILSPQKPSHAPASATRG